jgi:hypothetical protein
MAQGMVRVVEGDAVEEEGVVAGLGLQLYETLLRVAAEGVWDCSSSCMLATQTCTRRFSDLHNLDLHSSGLEFRV